MTTPSDDKAVKAKATYRLQPGKRCGNCNQEVRRRWPPDPNAEFSSLEPYCKLQREYVLLRGTCSEWEKA